MVLLVPWRFQLGIILPHGAELFPFSSAPLVLKGGGGGGVLDLKPKRCWGDFSEVSGGGNRGDP